ncbi:MAG: hypothetical protein M1837_001169 [Sclerophora amabilis]|nr:MAG: hypothetical protein M1837_001169 [Sclerophora amabilis]
MEHISDSGSIPDSQMRSPGPQLESPFPFDDFKSPTDDQSKREPSFDPDAAPISAQNLNTAGTDPNPNREGSLEISQTEQITNGEEAANSFLEGHPEVLMSRSTSPRTRASKSPLPPSNESVSPAGKTHQPESPNKILSKQPPNTPKETSRKAAFVIPKNAVVVDLIGDDQQDMPSFPWFHPITNPTIKEEENDLEVLFSSVCNDGGTREESVPQELNNIPSRSNDAEDHAEMIDVSSPIPSSPPEGTTIPAKAARRPVPRDPKKLALLQQKLARKVVAGATRSKGSAANIPKTPKGTSPKATSTRADEQRPHFTQSGQGSGNAVKIRTANLNAKVATTNEVERALVSTDEPGPREEGWLPIGEESDDAWMQQTLDACESSTDENEVEILETRNARKKKEGTLQLEDEIELIKARNKKTTQLRRRLGGNVTKQKDEGLFFPMNEELDPAKNKKRDRYQPYVRDESSEEETIDNNDNGELSNLAKRRRLNPERQPQADGCRPDYDLFSPSPPQDTTPAVTNVSAKSRELPAEPPAHTSGKDEPAPKKKTKSGKGRGRGAKNARDFHAKQQKKEEEKARKKRDKELKAVNKANGSKAKGAQNKKSRGRPVKDKVQSISSPRSKRTSWQTTERVGDMLNGLLHDDAIQDRIAQGDLGEAPVILTKSRKDLQLKELMASVPKDMTRLVTNDKQVLLRASRSFGHGRVKAEGAKWRLKGMKSPLYHHQLLGAEFMVSRECGDQAPRGGLLADSMGLGKTLQLLLVLAQIRQDLHSLFERATMVGNPPSTEDEERQATLLVLPSSIIRQWEEEIDLHVDKGVFPNIIHYKTSTALLPEQLQEYDIILTSYHEVMKSFPYPDQEERQSLDSLTLHDWVVEHWKFRGALHRVKFYRVALDEAQAIKNYRSRTTLACQSLDADLRWAMSATPIQNRLEEFFPYFRFLQIPFTQSFRVFKTNFCNPESETCRERVQAFLSFMMIRRTLKDKMFDRPIVELPNTESHELRIDFTPEERALYETIEEKFRQTFNKHLKDGTAEANYRTFLVMLLRLRQCCAHPFLLQQTIKNIFSLEDLKALERKLALNKDKRPICDQLSQWIRGSNEQGSGGNNDLTNDSNTVDADNNTFGRGSFGTSMDFRKYFGTLNEIEMMSRCTCNICGDLPEDAQITNCKHVFCRSCLQAASDRAAAKKDGDDIACPRCHVVLEKVEPFSKLDPRPMNPDYEDEIVEDEKGNVKKVPKDSWMTINMEGPMLASAKSAAVKKQILLWQAEAPQEKVVVYSQFRMMVTIIGKICEEEGWGYVTYTGDMSEAARHEAVHKIHHDPEVKIMIAGLKCGGLGLNLTAANRVISIDLWWNHSVEQQAFGRVFRIGQHKETNFTRLAIRGTVDDRLLGMQKDKTRVVTQAMNDTGRPPKPLSVRQLATLFGLVDEDEDGIPVIRAGAPE